MQRMASLSNPILFIRKHENTFDIRNFSTDQVEQIGMVANIFSYLVLSLTLWMQDV